MAGCYCSCNRNYRGAQTYGPFSDAVLRHYPRGKYIFSAEDETPVCYSAGRRTTANDWALIALQTDLTRRDIAYLQAIARIYDVTPMRQLVQCRIEKMERKKRCLDVERYENYESYKRYLERKYGERMPDLMLLIEPQPRPCRPVCRAREFTTARRPTPGGRKVSSRYMDTSSRPSEVPVVVEEPPKKMGVRLYVPPKRPPAVEGRKPTPEKRKEEKKRRPVAAGPKKKVSKELEDEEAAQQSPVDYADEPPEEKEGDEEDSVSTYPPLSRGDRWEGPESEASVSDTSADVASDSRGYDQADIFTPETEEEEEEEEGEDLVAKFPEPDEFIDEEEEEVEEVEEEGDDLVSPCPPPDESIDEDVDITAKCPSPDDFIDDDTAAKCPSPDHFVEDDDELAEMATADEPALDRQAGDRVDSVASLESECAAVDRRRTGEPEDISPILDVFQKYNPIDDPFCEIEPANPSAEIENPYQCARDKDSLYDFFDNKEELAKTETETVYGIK